jgi:hypothetical protein
MAPFLLGLHSGVRWLVVLITIIALIKLILGLVQKQSYDMLTQRIMMAFSGLTSLQWLIGLILLIALGNFSSGMIWSHAGVMTVAVAISHMHNRWKRSPDVIRYRNSLIVVIVVLVLVFIGVSIVNGWSR